MAATRPRRRSWKPTAVLIAFGALVLAVVGAGPALATGDHEEPEYETPAANPPWPDECGIDVAIVLDHSNSIMLDDAGNPDTMKAAAKDFVDALTGTPSSVAVLSFWKTAATELGMTPIPDASAAGEVKDAIDGIAFFTDSDNGSTNWDEGFREVSALDGTPDVTLFLTDGRPTVHLGDYGSGGTTNFEDVNEGIKSANAVKADGTRVVAVGIGGGIDVDNLELISGPEDNDDYYTTDFEQLGQQLQDIATRLCGGSITVTKQTPDGEGGWADAADWTFTASDDADPDQGTTDANGMVSFEWDNAAPVEVEVTEVPEAGYSLVQQDGANAVCTLDEQAVDTANVANGVELTVGPTDIISCVFRNIPDDPGLGVDKSVTSEGPYALGDTVTFAIAATNTGNVTLTGVTIAEGVADAELGTCDPAQPATLDPGETMTCTASHVVDLDDLVAGEFVNVAVADSDQTDPTDDDVVVPTPAPLVDVAVDKTQVTADLFQGQQATYSIVVSNLGPGLEPLPFFVDVLPTGTSFVAATGEGWTCVPLLGGTSVGCESATALAPGASLPPVELTVLVAGDSPTTLTNSVAAGGLWEDTNLANNFDEVSGPVTVVLGVVEVNAPPAAETLAATGGDGNRTGPVALAMLAAGSVGLVALRRRARSVH